MTRHGRHSPVAQVARGGRPDWMREGVWMGVQPTSNTGGHVILIAQLLWLASRTVLRFSRAVANQESERQRAQTGKSFATARLPATNSRAAGSWCG